MKGGTEYNLVQQSATLLERNTTLIGATGTLVPFAATFVRTEASSVRIFLFFEIFCKKLIETRAKSNLMDFAKSMIRPEVEGSTKQPHRTEKRDDEREGIPNEEHL